MKGKNIFINPLSPRSLCGVAGFSLRELAHAKACYSKHTSSVASLLSNKAAGELETLAQASHKLTLEKFGRTIKLYAPVYISNSCVNSCVYCGFNIKNKIQRRTLSVAEAVAEAEVLIARGHRNILFVAGEDDKNCPIELIESIVSAVRPKTASIMIEMRPFDEKGYARLKECGVDGVTLYQETYNKDVYAAMHPAGPKSKYESRLLGIEAAAAAGMRFLGLGALLGLNDWREETLSLVTHARYLMKKYWRSFVSISVPRIRDSRSGFKMPSPVSDLEMVQMICALRLALPECGIVLSTREPANLRDKLLPLGITQMSAGSVTNPGGYSMNTNSGEQFHFEDDRSPDTVAKMLKEKGYDPVWKDWDRSLT